VFFVFFVVKEKAFFLDSSLRRIPADDFLLFINDFQFIADFLDLPNIFGTTGNRIFRIFNQEPGVELGYSEIRLVDDNEDDVAINGRVDPVPIPKVIALIFADEILIHGPFGVVINLITITRKRPLEIFTLYSLDAVADELGYFCAANGWGIE